jgi:hypothetical protein
MVRYRSRSVMPPMSAIAFFHCSSASALRPMVNALTAQPA